MLTTSVEATRNHFVHGRFSSVESLADTLVREAPQAWRGVLAPRDLPGAAPRAAHTY